MKNIKYEDAITLLLDLEDEYSYRDYVLAKDNTLIGGEVGKSVILENLLKYKNDLQISEEPYRNIHLGICFDEEINLSLGITYFENHDTDNEGRIFIPTDYKKLTRYIENQLKND